MLGKSYSVQTVKHVRTTVSAIFTHAKRLGWHTGDNPAKRDDPADRPWRENLKRANRIREHWQHGVVADHATADLLATLRTATPPEACALRPPGSPQW